MINKVTCNELKKEEKIMVLFVQYPKCSTYRKAKKIVRGTQY